MDGEKEIVWFIVGGNDLGMGIKVYNEFFFLKGFFNGLEVLLVGLLYLDFWIFKVRDFVIFGLMV